MLKTRPNKWRRRLLDTFPHLDVAPSHRDLPPGHPDRALTIEVWTESGRHPDEDFIDAAHRVLRLAVGRVRYEALRAAAFQGAPWDARDRYVLRRLALAVCREFGPGNRHTLVQVDALARSLLLTQTELEQRHHEESKRRQLHKLHTEPTANRLPC